MKTALFTINWLLAILTGALFGGQSPVESSRLIIYRQKEFGAWSYTIYVNDKKVASLPPNRYLLLDIPAGRTRIEAGKDFYYYSTDRQTVWLNLKPGGVYYLKAVEEMDFLSRTLLMGSVNEELGRQQVRALKPIKPLPNSPNP